MPSVTKAQAASAAPGFIDEHAAYSLSEFGRRTGLGRWARRELFKRGGLRSVRVGTRRFILGRDWLDYLDRMAQQQAEGLGP